MFRTYPYLFISDFDVTEIKMFVSMHNFKNKTIKRGENVCVIHETKKICKKLSMFCYDEETAARKRLVFSRFIRVLNTRTLIFL